MDENPIADKPATRRISNRNTGKLNIKVKTTNTIIVAKDRNTKFPSDLPKKSRSREMGAIINAPTASFSNS